MKWKSLSHILVIRLDNMGDLIMTTPALRALKGDNQRKITLLGSPQNKKIAQFMPEIDEFILFEHSWMSADAAKTNAQEIVKQLKAHQYDGAIVFQSYNHNPLPAALITYLADIPKRAALCRENPFYLLTDWYPDPEPTRIMKHEVLRQLDLVRSLGFETTDNHLSLQIPQTAYQEMTTAVKQQGLDPAKPFIIMHPGASEELRRYPAEAFIESGKKLVKTHQVIVTGNGEEEQLVYDIVQKIGNNAYSCANVLSLEGFIALIDHAALLISNNTGPAHIAAAMQTPVVDLFPRPNSPLHFPWNVPHRLLFFDTPCKACIRGICNLAHDYPHKKVSAESIIEAAYELLNDSAIHS